MVGALRAATGLCSYESLMDFQEADLLTTRTRADVLYS